MGRPSLASERIPQILDAFERCIIKHGLKGSSLPLIAEEAGVKHSMIRHYIGNRDDLVMAMVSRFTEHYLEVVKTAITRTSGANRVAGAIEYLFHDVSLYDPGSVIFYELFAEADRNQSIRHILKGLYENVLTLSEEALSDAFPGISDSQAKALAYTLLSLWFGHTSLLHLGFGKVAVAPATTAAKTLVSQFTPEQGESHDEGVHGL